VPADKYTMKCVPRELKPRQTSWDLTGKGWDEHSQRGDLIIPKQTRGLLRKTMLENSQEVS
jgi:hypothetical protein